MENMTLSEYLNQKNLRPYVFATLAGVRFTTIYQLARGERPVIKTSTIRRIVEATDGAVTPGELID